MLARHRWLDALYAVTIMEALSFCRAKSKGSHHKMLITYLQCRGLEESVIKVTVVDETSTEKP